MTSTRPTPRLRGRAGQQQRQRRLLRTFGMCEDCRTEGITRLATAVDHIVPLSKGGPDTDANTRNLCDDHHRTRTAEQFGHRPPRLGVDRHGWPLDPNHPWQNRSK